ncbi:hypothetical protein [Luteibacter rhizovicinus]|uniref:hypothetical protein n=1 Tax=Luteibacter rhizovicinus TaxID=242606 RepID=UPI001404A5E5|nr:hypothetical protein [Luteibacter rhizovicinus]
MSILPQSGDSRVLAAGYVLFIVSGERVSILEVADGRLQFRMIEGSMTQEEQSNVLGFLNDEQKYLDRPEPAGPK